MIKCSSTNREFLIGEIYLMYFDGDGSEQRGLRPGVVFQNNMGNKYSPNIVALPLTTAIKKANQPTHVVIPCEGTGLRKDSMVLCENPVSMSKDKIGEYITTLPDKYMAQIAAGSILASSAIAYIDPAALTLLWKRAASLNQQRIA